ncbi:MAG: hypothetical protein GC206_17010 [Alphaproteobacteria bacterium]|nr:hypothetical protein [Alphaproteobacteria bacterium]
MNIVWMLVTLIGNQVIESGVTFNNAKACFERAAALQVEAFKAVDLAFILNHQQNLSAEPARPTFSCIVTEYLGE